MSSSTLPKSVQATERGQGGAAGGPSASGAHERLQQIKEFVDRFRQLPDDFLRLPAYYYADHFQAAVAQDTIPSTRAFVAREGAPLVDMIDISVVEAQLVKNYGLLRMDLYCKIRVGHMVCETQTCSNGGKNPKWDGVYQFTLKPGIDSFHLEIYDEKHFSLDEKVAWLCAPIPPEVFQGITVERWFPLSGRLGPNEEGSILLVLSHKRMPMRPSQYARHAASVGVPPLTVLVPADGHPGPTIMGGPTSVMPVTPHNAPNAYIQAPAIGEQEHPRVGAGGQQQQADQHETLAPPQPIRDEDVDLLSEMFPSIDKAVIRAVLENHHNDKEAAIGALLALG